MELTETQNRSARKKVQKHLDKEIEKRVNDSLLYFLLEKWRISSGEHAGERFSFKDRPFLLGLVEDKFPFQVCLKSAQSGISEIKLAKCIHGTIAKKSNALYTMPAGEQMQQFVDSRARTAILHSEFLSQYVTGSLNLKKFEIAKRQIYFRGVQKRRQIISVDVSRLFADEADEYEEGTLYTLDKRLGAAKNPERDYFSTPKFHGSGISFYYYGSENQGERGSDQRVWTIRCESCGQWNEDLIWAENVRDLNEKDIKFSHYQANAIVICRYCGRALDRLSADAEWVPKFLNNVTYCHGYHISKLMAPATNLNQMMVDSHDPVKEQEFFNSDLGLPYEPEGSKLTDELIDRCRASYTLIIKSSAERYNVGGADIGNQIHAIASTRDENNKIKVLSVKELDDWDDLDYFFKDFNLSCLV